MQDEKKFFKIHYVGLGGTGCNVLETVMRGLIDDPSPLKEAGAEIAFFAMDVAEPDLASLTKRFKALEEKLRENDLATDKVALFTHSIKFPSIDALYNFVQTWPRHFEPGEAIVPADGYRPVIDRAHNIPPLVGGVGRKRALSKSIYNMNYLVLKDIQPKLDGFKSRLTRDSKKIVVLLYGMGGGSGSGIALDFARHLRAALTKDAAILGVGILPCSADDKNARGSSAYAAICEHEALVDGDSNETFVRAMGPGFANPFTAFLTLPLGPALTYGGSLPEARESIDRAVVEILFKSLQAIDFEDLRVGRAMTARWIHAATMLQISIPLREHVEIARADLRALDILLEVNEARKSLFGVATDPAAGLLGTLMEAVWGEALACHAAYLTAVQRYKQDAFLKDIERFLKSSARIDSDFTQTLAANQRGLHELSKDLQRPIRSLGLGQDPSSLKFILQQEAGKILELIGRLPEGHATFAEDAQRHVEEVQRLLNQAQKEVTPAEKEVLRGLIQVAYLVGRYIRDMRRLHEIEALAKETQKEMGALQRTPDLSAFLDRLDAIRKEVVFLNLLLSSMIAPAEKEAEMDLLVKSAGSRLEVWEKGGRELRAKAEVSGKAFRVAEQKRKIGQEEFDRFKWVPIKGGQTRDRLDAAKLEERRAKEIADRDQVRVDEVEARVNAYQKIVEMYRVASHYRKHVSELAKAKKSSYDRLNEVSRDRGLYHKVKEFTEQERLRVLQHVIAGGTGADPEKLVAEIIDRDHLRTYLRTALSMFKDPNSLGLAESYRTDKLEVAVIANKRLWDNDLSTDVKTALAGYVMHDVDRSIQIKHEAAGDPYNIRAVLLACNARPEDLRAFADIEALYRGTPLDERRMAHSLGLEHGVVVGRQGTIQAQEATIRVPVQEQPPDKRVVP